ncbi:exo-alpha-sialidase [Kribbella sandramycini]|uniref:Exo-alpha-sialidase n=1 Tax=Kribbella sandramycini TaxID=60450 RepID=A0A7Y4L7K5_9ACTN|nr:sialidase family protein [Kribbella sandramycini]MBB6566904.1 hypothetical protein [Kribbella sandramycini]NOL44626.1 exo-alpha-sialidase [Kribbella sandramycini]
MSDLKDLVFSVQETVDAPPFATLARRASHRRARRRTSLLVAVTAVVATVYLLLNLPGADGSKVPIAPQPSVNTPAPDLDNGEDLVRGPGATLLGVAATGPTRWVSSWNACPRSECRFAAALGSEGMMAFAPTRPNPWRTLIVAGDPVALYTSDLALEPDHPGWGSAMFVTLNAEGSTQSGLSYASPTATYDSDEVVTDLGQPGLLAVLNLQNSTLRRLELPDSVGKPGRPVRDLAGNVYFLGGQANDTIYWTLDRGQTWKHEPLDDRDAGRWLAVSPSGGTIVATSSKPATDALDRLATTKVSVDGGATWRIVQNTPYGIDGAPVALDDNTVLMAGRSPGAAVSSLYSITDGKVQLIKPAPQVLAGLAGNTMLVYGTTVEKPSATLTRVAFTTDRGQSWSYFTPR